jgi:hypothetical protein
MRHPIRLREQHPAFDQGMNVRIAVACIHNLRITAIFFDDHYDVIGARQRFGMHSRSEQNSK